MRDEGVLVGEVELVARSGPGEVDRLVPVHGHAGGDEVGRRTDSHSPSEPPMPNPSTWMRCPPARSARHVAGPNGRGVRQVGVTRPEPGRADRVGQAGGPTARADRVD